MANYTYLKDGTPLTAASLNERFEGIKGEVNDINATNLAKGALNTVHMPHFIGPANTTLTSALFTTESVKDEVDSGLILADGVHNSSARPGFSLDLTDGDAPATFENIVLNSTGRAQAAGREAVTALLVLGNVSIAEFWDAKIEVWQEGTKKIYGITLNEHQHAARVGIQVNRDTGTGFADRSLVETERTVSPRVTIGRYGNNIGYPMSPLRSIPGGAGDDARPLKEQFDYRTYQDVSIRAIITADDLIASGADVFVKRVQFYFKTSDRFPLSYKVDRASLTVIPLKAKVIDG
jgi:hypothetical protein